MHMIGKLILNLNLFLIVGFLLYNIVLVSAMYQHELAIGIHMSPPSSTFLPLPTPSYPSWSQSKHCMISKLEQSTQQMDISGLCL